MARGEPLQAVDRLAKRDRRERSDEADQRGPQQHGVGLGEAEALREPKPQPGQARDGHFSSRAMPLATSSTATTRLKIASGIPWCTRSPSTMPTIMAGSSSAISATTLAS